MAPDNHSAAEEVAAPLESPDALPSASGEPEILPGSPLVTPVASLQPPMALLLPEAADHALLENRIHRLETELAQMRNSSAAESRFAQRPVAAAAQESGGLWGRLLGSSGPAKTSRAAAALPSLVPPSVRHTWLLFDALAELRAMYWMFFDPRYHLSWTARLLPLILLALIFTSYYWTPGTSLPFPIGTVIEKTSDLILAYFLFKLLSYESRRYRETAPDLPPSLRL